MRFQNPGLSYSATCAVPKAMCGRAWACPMFSAGPGSRQPSPWLLPGLQGLCDNAWGEMVTHSLS